MSLIKRRVEGQESEGLESRELRVKRLGVGSLK